jgi:hypothetical protein
MQLMAPIEIASFGVDVQLHRTGIGLRTIAISLSPRSWRIDE